MTRVFGGVSVSELRFGICANFGVYRTFGGIFGLPYIDLLQAFGGTFGLPYIDIYANFRVYRVFGGTFGLPYIGIYANFGVYRALGGTFGLLQDILWKFRPSIHQVSIRVRTFGANIRQNPRISGETHRSSLHLSRKCETDHGAVRRAITFTYLLLDRVGADPSCDRAAVNDIYDEVALHGVCDRREVAAAAHALRMSVFVVESSGDVFEGRAKH